MSVIGGGCHTSAPSPLPILEMYSIAPQAVKCRSCPFNWHVCFPVDIHVAARCPAARESPCDSAVWPWRKPPCSPLSGCAGLIATIPLPLRPVSSLTCSPSISTARDLVLSRPLGALEPAVRQLCPRQNNRGNTSVTRPETLCFVQC